MFAADPLILHINEETHMPIKDYHATWQHDQTGPIVGAFDVTPDDGADLAVMTRAIMVTVAGDVAVVFKDGSAITMTALQPGVQYAVRLSRVRATGTTATGIKGLY